jgi:hypothetical protein
VDEAARQRADAAFGGVRRASPEGPAPARRSRRRWWVALGVVLPLLFIAAVAIGYAIGGPWLAVGVALLCLTVLAMRSLPILLAGAMRRGDARR